MQRIIAETFSRKSRKNKKSGVTYDFFFLLYIFVITIDAEDNWEQSIKTHFYRLSNVATNLLPSSGICTTNKEIIKFMQLRKF